MTRYLHLTLDTSAQSTAKAIAAAARVSPLLILTGRALADLTDELGSWEAAGRYLLSVAETIGKPIGVNAPTSTGSQTLFLAPRSWSSERLQGWVAGYHDLLERQFGAATVLALEES